MALYTRSNPKQHNAVINTHLNKMLMHKIWKLCKYLKKQSTECKLTVSNVTVNNIIFFIQGIDVFQLKCKTKNCIVIFVFNLIYIEYKLLV